MSDQSVSALRSLSSRHGPTLRELNVVTFLVLRTFMLLRSLVWHPECWCLQAGLPRDVRSSARTLSGLRRMRCGVHTQLRRATMLPDLRHRECGTQGADANCGPAPQHFAAGKPHRQSSTICPIRNIIDYVVTDCSTIWKPRKAHRVTKPKSRSAKGGPNRMTGITRTSFLVDCP
jgi:hypothetical protein